MVHGGEGVIYSAVISIDVHDFHYGGDSERTIISSAYERYISRPDSSWDDHTFTVPFGDPLRPHHHHHHHRHHYEGLVVAAVVVHCCPRPGLTPASTTGEGAQILLHRQH
ncbi:hypothetical protein Pcinc_007240 [Petrolisthes cinctipes]|uniref:Uncharacterized protein n=1 Tax=Petrolisthes cinctipes TaxID=88211 RepID=A0AAE1GBC8_PETCI|nr:hypothetical protein Pcinc_007240 [Petrolisthes cinctipes]